jgi:hypothetical protein
VPAPRAGYVWSQGHYELINDQYVWRPGQWLAERPGYRYVAPAWSQVGNQWRYVPSRWDRNGDGVPDRYQAQRPYDNRHGAWGDRDHDGIPNALDSWDNRRR